MHTGYAVSFSGGRFGSCTRRDPSHAQDEQYHTRAYHRWTVLRGLQNCRQMGTGDCWCACSSLRDVINEFSAHTTKSRQVRMPSDTTGLSQTCAIPSVQRANRELAHGKLSYLPARTASTPATAPAAYQSNVRRLCQLRRCATRATPCGCLLQSLLTPCRCRAASSVPSSGLCDQSTALKQHPHTIKMTKPTNTPISTDTPIAVGRFMRHELKGWAAPSQARGSARYSSARQRREQSMTNRKVSTRQSAMRQRFKRCRMHLSCTRPGSRELDTR